MLARTPTLVEARALLARHDYAKAAERFLQACKENERDVHAYHGLAWSLCRAAGGKLPILRSPDFDTAAAALARALELEPDNAVSVALLALCFMNAGAPERASDVVQTFLRRHPFDVQVVGLMAALAAQPEQAVSRLGLLDKPLIYSGPRLDVPTQAVTSHPHTEFMNVSYSQEGEDLVLARLFHAQKLGLYVDVGAHHPLRFSNTHRFYLQGWRGVNIEPNPELMAAFAAVRPGDVNVACGVSNVYGKLTYYMFNDPALNSFDEELTRSRESGAYHVVQTRELDVVPLADLLDQCLVPGAPIHFMSVDVEGLDLKVLESNDWERFRPRCVVVECLQSDVAAVLGSTVHGFMRAQGYRLFAKTFNSVFYLEGDFQV